MFDTATRFNQDLSNWNVSSGVKFVRIRFARLTGSIMGWKRVGYGTISDGSDPNLLLCGVTSNLFTFLFFVLFFVSMYHLLVYHSIATTTTTTIQSLATRDRCFFKPPRSIKIYPAGTFLRGKVLYVCPNCNTVNFQGAIDSSPSLFFCALISMSSRIICSLILPNSIRIYHNGMYLREPILYVTVCIFLFLFEYVPW